MKAKRKAVKTTKTKKVLKHEEAGREKMAAFYHLGFAALYALAIVWHLKGALEHFQETAK